MKNYYEVIGVNPSATPEEIRKEYRRKARNSHPDRGGDKAVFQELTEAYEVLSDEVRRLKYDRLRQKQAEQEGCVLCRGCGTPNFIRRRPKRDEQLLCAHCNMVLPVDFSSALNMQRQRLVTEAARVMDDVGVELAETVIDVAKSGLARLRKRFARS